ncbi:MAG: class I tRNA ligase family protein [Candidatus Coatesbacteria bacterium]
MSRFYVTTPIYYSNAPLHLGHAYCTIACDVLARWHRLRGDDTFFLTGLDEHGGNIEKIAKESGITPQEWCDRMAVQDLEFYRELKVSNDDFIRTTEERHRRCTDAFWRAARANKTPEGRDNIYLGEYEGWYCPKCEAYFVEEDLVEGNCPVHEVPVEKLKEESYFFRLSDYTGFLKDYLAANPDFVVPEQRKAEMLGLLREGLRDISISRTKVRWGFPVPDDPGHVIYVWFDAVINYLTALGYPDMTGPRWKYWEVVHHVVGKEILRFHALLWPAMLKAAGLPLPKKVVAHGWWTVDGKKMGKSMGNQVDPRDYARKYGLDAVRHYLLAEVSFGSDGDFSDKRFIERYNTDLANVLGNLAHRTIAMAHRYSQGKIAAPKGESRWEAFVKAEFPDRREAIEAVASGLGLSFTQAAFVTLADVGLGAPEFQGTLERIWRVLKDGNKYLDERAPWNQEPAEREETLGQVLVLLEAASWPLLAFMPESAGRLRERLGLPADRRAPLPDVFTVIQGDPLFPRIDTKKKA